MIRTYYEAICAGEEIRANLISLKEALKSWDWGLASHSRM